MISACNNCGSQYESNSYFVHLCNVCIQTRELKAEGEKNRKHNELLLKRSQEFAIQQQRDQQRDQQRHQDLLANQQKLNDLANSITTAKGYEYGRSYVYNYGKGYEDGFYIYFDDLGNIKYNIPNFYNNLYPLNSSAAISLIEGIEDELQLLDYSTPLFDELQEKVYSIGKEIALGNIPSSFCLHEVIVNNIKFQSSYESNMVRWSIKNTPYIELAWSKPFANDELNKCFNRGVNDSYWLHLNSEENINKRIFADQKEYQYPDKGMWEFKKISETPDESYLSLIDINLVDSNVKANWELIKNEKKKFIYKLTSSKYFDSIKLFAAWLIPIMILFLILSFL